MNNIKQIISELKVTINWCNHFARQDNPKNSLRKSEDYFNKRDEFSGLFFRDFDALSNIIQEISDYKRYHLSIENKILYDGKIIVYYPNESTCDGSAPIESNDLFGECDNPPADTWFYVFNNEIKGISILCWIPDIFVSYTQNVIDICAPPGIISWLRDENYLLHKEIKNQFKELYPS